MKQLKYIQQKKSYDCGEVVILNTLTWAGKYYSYKKYYPIFNNMLDLHPKHKRGTCGHCFDLFIKTVKKNNKTPFKVIKKRLNLKMKDIILNVGQSRAIIFGNTNLLNAHISLIINASKHFLYVVNLGGKNPVRKISKKKFKDVYLKQWTIGYFLEKNNEKI